MSNPRVALVHDWLTGMRGGEKVLEHFADMFPDAPIYTLLHVPGSVSRTIERHPIHVSPLQKMPRAASHYRHYFPLMPWLVEQLKIEPVDLVLSTSSCVAKSVRAPAGARHASYVFSPMRYLYDRYDDYFSAGRAGLATRIGMRLVRGPMQRWDTRTANRVHSMVGISRFIAERIQNVYGRVVPVIHPPVDCTRFAAARRAPEDYYLMVTALVPYKSVDVAVEAFRGLDRKLVVVGSGPMLRRLQKICPPNVELRGWVDDAELPSLVAGCKASLFPNVEDFGIAPVEAMAAGRPVIALAAGGALDTIRDLDHWRTGVLKGELGPTGLFHEGASPKDLARAVRRFEKEEAVFSSNDCQSWARTFDGPSFRARIRHWLDAVLEGKEPASISSPFLERSPASVDSGTPRHKASAPPKATSATAEQGKDGSGRGKERIVRNP
ncbi:MAG: glycosyltransferase [Planctomycetota bacterium]